MSRKFCGKTIDSDLKVKGDLLVEGETLLRDDLSVRGTTTLDGPLIVNNTAVFNKQVDIKAPINFEGPINITGPINFPNPLNIPGDVNIGGQLTVEGGLTVLGSIRHTFTQSGEEYIVPNDIFVTTHIFNVLLRQLKTISNIELPFQDAPLGDIQNPPGDVTFDNIHIQVTNIPSIAPWYFKDLTDDPKTKFINDTPGTRVLYGGLPEIYSFGTNYNGVQPPLDNTVTQVNLTITANAVATFDLLLRYSSEFTYDFVFVILNNTTLFSDANRGPSVDNPYLGITVPITMGPTDTLTIRYVKDPCCYEGVDNIYFYIRNFVLSPVPKPTNLIVFRGDQELINFAYTTNFDAVTFGKILLDFFYRKGDRIVLQYDTDAYQQFVLQYIATI